MPIYERTLANGDKVWDVKVSNNGVQKMIRGNTSERKAIAVEKRENRKAEAFRVGLAGQVYTVSELADEWLEFKEPRIKPSTYKDYGNHVRLRIKPALGEKKIGTLEPRTIQDFIDSLAERPRTADKTLTVLRMMFRYARRQRLTDYNPASDVDGLGSAEKQREMNFLAPAEAQALLAACGDSEGLMIRVGLMTGMRSAEVRGLFWGDLEGSYIHVRREYKDGIFQEPKTRHSKRRVLIPPALRDELEGLRGDHDALIFTIGEGQPVPDWYPTKRILYPVFDRMDAMAAQESKRDGRRFRPVKRVTFHELRHSYACWMLSDGESINFVQAQLGHHSPAFTLKRYGHFLPERHGEVMERFEERHVSKLYQASSGKGAQVHQIRR